MACRVPAAKLGVPGRYFVQTEETAGLTRMFLLFLLPLQCVSPVLRRSAASICMFAGVTACSCDVWLFSPSVGNREVKSFGRAFVSFGIFQAAV